MTACVEARIATAEVVHIDASLIRADVSWESLVERHVSEVIKWVVGTNLSVVALVIAALKLL